MKSHASISWYFVLALSVMAGSIAHAADLGGGPVKVFILAGQSNMEGYGGINTVDTIGTHPNMGHLLRKIKKEDGSFVVRDDVFISYQRGNEAIKGPLTFGQGAFKDRMGPELMFGITMGDAYREPVLLIKTAWGGKDLYCDFRPPSAGKPAYKIPGVQRDLGVFYRKMVEEVRQCLSNLETGFPQFKGRGFDLSGFVWFQGWNDMCADQSIVQQVFDEYATNFAHLVHDLRAEFKVPKLLVAVGEVGVEGERANGSGIRLAQAKIPDQPELKGTVGYVRTSPFWYPALDEMTSKFAAEEARAKQQGGDLTKDVAYMRLKEEHDKHISHWICHYYGSARVYALVGHGLAEAMLQLTGTRMLALTGPGPYVKLASLAKQIQSGQNLGAAFKTLNEKKTSKNPAEAAEAEAMLAAFTTGAQEQLDEALLNKDSNPAEAISRLDSVAKKFNGSEFAVQAKRTSEAMKKDPKIKKEMQAFVMLDQILALETTLKPIPNSTDLRAEAYRRQNTAALQGVMGGCQALLKRFPDTRAARKAIDIMDKYR